VGFRLWLGGDALRSGFIPAMRSIPPSAPLALADTQTEAECPQLRPDEFVNQ